MTLLSSGESTPTKKKDDANIDTQTFMRGNWSKVNSDLKLFVVTIYTPLTKPVVEAGSTPPIILKITKLL